MGNRILTRELLHGHETLRVKDESFGIKKSQFEGRTREEEKKSKVHTPVPMSLPKTVPVSEKLVEEYKKIDFSNFMCKAIEILGKENSEAKTWKQKLELINNILHSTELENKELAAIGGYLQLINNGQIKCDENGQHFRPNHHAGLALNIYKLLTGKINKENSFLIKIILKNLPSFSSKFQASVPLTRIRDIAHRGDIPKELKLEIKTTLQNKLHRNASPEDLVTAKNILAKVKEYFFFLLL